MIGVNNGGGLCSDDGILGRNELVKESDIFLSPANQFLVESAHAVKVAAVETSQAKAKMPPIAALLGDVGCVGFPVEAENDGKVNLFPESGVAAACSEEFGTDGNVNVAHEHQRLWRQETNSDFKSKATGKSLSDTVIPNLFCAVFLLGPRCTTRFLAAITL